MDKKILIGGGVAAVAVVVVIVMRSRSSAKRAQEAEDSMMPETTPDTGYFSNMSPISGGMSSDGQYSAGGGGASGISDPANSGSSGTGGGFDLAAILSGMFSSQAEVNKMSVIAGEHNYDSSVLASIVGSDGQATVSHSATGTVVTNTPNADAYTKIINDMYQQQLKRAPDVGGLAFWKNSLINGNVSIATIQKEFQTSPEYIASHTTQNTTSTTSSTGVVETVQSKKQA